ncbi:hypothetical protein DVH24_026165 [Malus domestica]|uniref:Uncharacterized protein n=1 Tax=Malus domestica TaxID=3750 RepID=A0A498KFT1_MALDO|nr:hypothetical protein DVH24_026165 [Malus domestica]
MEKKIQDPKPKSKKKSTTPVNILSLEEFDITTIEMGNCQAAEAATVVIQHPGNNKIERIYWSVGAHEVMTSNLGH